MTTEFFPPCLKRSARIVAGYFGATLAFLLADIGVNLDHIRLMASDVLRWVKK